MIDHPFLSVIIPAYNEQTRIVSAITSVAEYLRSQNYTWELLIVDDGSTDETETIVKCHPDYGESVRLVSVIHGGKGWAVQNGMLNAKGLYQFLCDADLSMPIQHLQDFLPPKAPDGDIIIGSREMPMSSRFGEPFIRHLMGRIYNSIVRFVAVSDIRDTQCGFKCFTKESAEKLSRLQTIKGFGFDVELLYVARKLGLKISEVPIDWYYNSDSKVRPFHDSIRSIVDLLVIKWNNIRGKYLPTTID
ncbi:glycosyltransferase family 2 protein [SAR202 cluster bacterium AC-409-J13_OGT_754m]|nr:glycosyltransferase family 2 protein [SAR202 cluster bacterium AC-409-J13_OGT_754m]